MGSQISQLITSNFQNFGEKYSPSLTGGLMNYIWDPEKDPTTGNITLKMSKITMPYLVETLKEYFLTTKDNLRVLNVLPTEVHPDKIEPRQYMSAVIGGASAIVIAIFLLLAVLITPCAFKCGKKRADGFSRAKSIVYLIFGILSTLLTLFLVVCIPITFSATDTLVKSISPKAKGDQKAPITQKMDTIFGGTELFLQELVRNGTDITDKTLKRIQMTVKNEVHPAVQDTMDKLLEQYGATAMEQRVKHLHGVVPKLKTISDDIKSKKDQLVNRSNPFQDNMNKHVDDLLKSLQKLCKNPANIPTAEQKCKEYEEKIKKLNVNISLDTLLNESTSILSESIDLLEQNLGTILKEIDKMKASMQGKVNELTTTIDAKINFEEQLRPVKDVWSNLERDFTRPTIQQMKSYRPEIDKYLNLAGTVANAAGYALVVILLLNIVVILIYVIICIIDAVRQGFWPFGDGGGGDAIRKLPACGFTLPAILSIFTPIMVIIGVVLVLITILLNNEACRYVVKPKAIKITSAASDLLLRHEWQDLVVNGIKDEKVKSFLNLPPPKNALESLLIHCKPSLEGGYSPSLLPQLGIKNLVNVNAVVEQPEIKNAVTQAETQVVQEVRSLNLKSIFPQDINSTLEKMKSVAKSITELNYTDVVANVKKNIPTEDSFESVFKELTKWLEQFSTDQNARDMMKTIEDMRKELKSLEEITQKLTELEKSLSRLEDIKPLSQDLKYLAKLIDEVRATLSNDQKIEEPIKSVFKTAVDRLFVNLKPSIEKDAIYLTTNVVYCGRINTVLTTAIETACDREGLISQLGGFMFLLLLTSLPLLFTVFCFQVFLGLHQEQCD